MWFHYNFPLCVLLFMGQKSENKKECEPFGDTINGCNSDLHIIS